MRPGNVAESVGPSDGDVPGDTFATIRRTGPAPRRLASAPSAPMTAPTPTPNDRRDFLARLGALGGTTTLFPGVLWAKLAEGAELTDATIVAAAEVTVGLAIAVQLMRQFRTLQTDEINSLKWRRALRNAKF